MKLKRSLWTVYIALNMLWTSIIFFGIARHRESTSSLVGRYATKGNKVALLAERVINRMHPDEPNHCRATWCDEEEMRDEWYDQDDW